MNLNESQIAKIDPLLEQVLTSARGDEVIRAIMSLGVENQMRTNASILPLEPKQFPSYEVYRQALVDRRKSQLASVVGDTIQSLQNLSLKTSGVGLSPVVVVEGSADAIVRSLELPEVNRVRLDQLIALPEIVPDEALNHLANLYINILDCPIEEKIKKLISLASEQYIINYHKSHNKLQILGMHKPVDLDSIYIVQCLLPSEIWQFESIQALQELYRQAGKRGFQVKYADKQDGIAVANQQKFLMILGAPGAGKSTFLRKIGLEALKGNRRKFQHECIPVFIELKQFADREINIEEVIRQEFRSCQLPFFEEFTTKALQQGKLLILLDGLDEVPTKNIDWAVRQIQDFVEQYNKNRFITSCRTAAYRRSFQQFSEAVIADFDDTQIQQFIQNWFFSEVDKKVGTSEKCWNLLNKAEYEATKELAKTPLLLTFLCLVYDEYQDFPKNRSTLYSDALDIFLRKWVAEKRIQGEPIYRDIGIDLEKIMLSEIAYKGFEVDRLFLSQQEVVSQITEFLASNDNAPNLEAGAVLDAITIQQGILVERARDVYSFSHLTLQEYLTAKYIDDHRQIEKLVVEHLKDKRWQEVFLLVAGLMDGGADDLLLQMEKEAQKYINTPKLQNLLSWVEKVTTGSEGNFNLVGKRAVAIANAIANTNAHANTITIAISIANAYASAITYAYAIAYTNAYAYAHAYASTHAHDYAYANANAVAQAYAYARELDKLKIFNNVNFTMLIAQLEALKVQAPDDEQPLEIRLAFDERLETIWLNAFHLTPEMINLSQEESKALGNYLYANYLIIQCKEAAVRVSPTTWQAIEERMLLVSSNHSA